MMGNSAFAGHFSAFNFFDETAQCNLTKHGRYPGGGELGASTKYAGIFSKISICDERVYCLFNLSAGRMRLTRKNKADAVGIFDSNLF